MIAERILQRFAVGILAVIVSLVFAAIVASFIIEAGSDLSGRLSAIQEGNQ